MKFKARGTSSLIYGPTPCKNNPFIFYTLQNNSFRINEK